MIKDVKKVKKGTYLINDEVLLFIQDDGSVKANFDENLTDDEVEQIINEFFEKPVEHLS